MDAPYPDIVRFLHGTCWISYREEGLLYPMPKYAGYTDDELSSQRAEIEMQ